jgi:WD40 repeat protein
MSTFARGGWRRSLSDAPAIAVRRVVFEVLATAFLACTLPTGQSRGDDSPKPPITALAFAPDGKSIVSGSQAGIDVRSWPEIKSIRSLKTSLAHVHDLTFEPEGKLLYATGGSPGEKGVVEFLPWPDGPAGGSLTAHNDLIYRLAVRSDGKGFATASADHLVLVQNHGEPQPRKLAGHSRAVLAIAYLPDNLTLVSAGADQSLRVWNADEGKLIRTLDNHTAAVYDLAVRPGHAEGPPLVASAGADRTVRLWQPTVGRLVRFARLPSAPLALAWTKNGARLVCSCADGRMRVLDPDTVQVVSEHAALEGWAYSLALSPDDRFAVVGGPGGAIKVVELETKP